MNRRSWGFTLVEVLLVIVMIAILVGIAVPMLRVSIARADAARVRTDVHQLELAALQFREEGGGFPETTGWGQAPSTLTPFLAEGTPFRYKDVEYRLVLTGTPREGERFQIQARYPEDSRVGEALQAFRGEDVIWTRQRTTFLLYP